MTKPTFSTSEVEAALSALQRGTRYRFADWPNREMPLAAAGVYAVWDRELLVYVGMSGRSQTEETLRTHQENAPKKAKGLADRLKSHAAGRRSGDQFCVYVFDKWVLPALTREEVERAAAGELSLDAKTRAYIHARFEYSYVVVPCGPDARTVEDAVRHGRMAGAVPLLNPGKRGGPPNRVGNGPRPSRRR